MRNYLFATIDHRASVVLGANAKYRSEPLDDLSTLEQRQQASDAVRHELEAAGINDLREDVFLTSEVGKAGIALIRTETDPFSGEVKLALDSVDLTRFYPDPAANRMNKCQYICYEPELDLSQIRDLCDQFGCPEKFDAIKPKKAEPVGTGNTAPERRIRDTEEILRSPGTDITLDKESKVRSRKADVQYVWIADKNSFSTEIEKVVTESGSEGMACMDCGAESDIGPECPECGSNNLTLDKEVTQRTYPFGRLIVTCQGEQIYDGPNPDELEEVYPFEVFLCKRIPGEFWGFSTLDLLKSNQMQADKTISQLIDAFRLCSNGFLQVPKDEEAWMHVSNEPGQKIPVRPENANIARVIAPPSMDAQMFAIADNTIFADFQRLSGESDNAVTASPSAPDSATEVSSRDRVRYSRIGRDLARFNEFTGRIATKAYQLMVQKYVGPRTFMLSSNGYDRNPTNLDMSTFPRGIRIRVEADLDSLERDKNAAQNLALAMSNGQLPYMPDVYLRALGEPESVIAEIMQRPEMKMFTVMKQMEMQAQLNMIAAAAMSGGTALPQGNGPGKASPTGPASQQRSNSGGGEN